jgi:two-component system LytT family response regulator
MPDRLRAMIVDDEPLARQELRTMLAEHPDVEVVGEAASVAAASRLLRTAVPQVLFLDIQLVGETGFELLRDAPAYLKVVFVTAHAEHAVRAFEVRASDYLLKPVEPTRLAETLGRVRAPREADRAPLGSDDRLFLRVLDARGESRHRFITINAIVCITADGDYSRVATIDGAEWGVGKALREWEVRLPARQFVRVHRSTIVNLEHVERVEEWSHYSYLLYVAKRRTPLTLSRRYAMRLRGLLA